MGPAVAGGGVESELACAVGGIVVDDEHLHPLVGSKNGFHQRADIIPLVERGHHHKHAAIRPVG